MTILASERPINVPDEAPLVPGFYDKLGIMYLQLGLSAIQRSQYAIEQLRTHWDTLTTDQRREQFGRAASALSNAESSATAISTWRGRVGKTFTHELKRLKAERMKAGDTAAAKMKWIDERKTLIEKTLLAADVLLAPVESAEDYYEAGIFWIIEHSEPVRLKDQSVHEDGDEADDDLDDKLDAFDDDLESLEEGEPDA